VITTTTIEAYPFSGTLFY